ncbi:MAG: hypothetical protein LC725_08830 [Lentisphaerae bacterium]|nr:hypothetical protein [Lentisphaerota bacterium]
MRIVLSWVSLHLLAVTLATAGTISVSDPVGNPVQDAEVVFVHPVKKLYKTGQTDENGKLDLMWESKGSVVVFCAHPDFRAFRKSGHNPDNALEITLRKQQDTGSVVCANGTGYVPGLTGRISPIHDTYNRLYIYADNISINDGTQQPVPFQLGRRLRAEDQEGNQFELTVVEIIGKTSLIEFKKRK